MYNNDERACIWLDSFNISTKKKISLLNLFNSAEELLSEFKNCRDDILEIIDIQIYNQMAILIDDNYIDKLINSLMIKNVKVLTIASEIYPHKLSDNLVDPPIVLYYKGNIELLDTLSIAIVGARRLTRYGKDVTEKFSRELSLNGFCIISGLARGADTVAHTECLLNEGKTVAVLGCGIDVVYPKENKDLYNEIAKNGLIISEFPLGTEPYSYNFPQRNRIISALADGVLVTEAGEKSGTIITANLALDMGKELYAVPGSIFSEQSIGTNNLIKSYDSVFMVTNVNDILKQFNIKERDMVKDAIQLDFLQQCVVDELSKGRLHIEEIITKTNMEIGSLFAVLQGLISARIIRQLPGNFYELQPN